MIKNKNDEINVTKFHVLLLNVIKKHFLVIVNQKDFI